ncbi:extracellular solute-binding protein [Paenibacillus sp. LHD-117]|uniref:ABC transporter substrate-binding protein n=1 Tax=Paenibacillus sp. LHD-117 TaxID=3071412 RepID=UPI0027E14828|nr:extracellular solute-binding protein [Paenibacillus sp. LHD-117]MDQ6418903.1 extracellular solute-binding protein [Paenibacillus sp. LHD-117]
MKQAKIATLTLAASLALFGCSGNNNEPASPSSSPASQDPSPAPSEETGNAGPELSGDVVFWSMWSDSEPQAKVIESAVKEFQSTYPKVKVNVKFTGRDINKLIKPALDGGEKIDIFEGDPSNAIGSLKDHVLKLDDYLSSPAIGMEGKAVQDSILPSLMNWTKSLSVAAGLEEGYYALPQQPYAVLFFYNKAVFEKAGVTAPPATWEEFMNANELIKQSGVDPITFDDAYRDLFIGGYLSSAMGHEWVDQLVNDKTGDMWKDPIILQFANDIVAMREKGYFSKKIAGSKYPAAQQDLVLGQSAAYLNGTWLPNEVSATAGPDFAWGSFQFPAVPGGNGNGGQKELTFGAQALMLNKNSGNKDAAIELVKYLIGKTAQEGMVQQAQAIPATVDTEWPAALAEASAAIDRAEVNAPWGFGINNNADFSKSTIVPVFMELVAGKMSAEEYVTKMSAEAKKFHSAG